MKHAILLHLVEAMTRDAVSLAVVDTHAGAGIYDLRGGEAMKTGEAAAGVARLMAADTPAVFDLLKAAVRRANRGDETRFYPGSPLLIADALRARDRLVACEVRPDDHAALEAALRRRSGAEAVLKDGWAVARETARRASRLLVFVDPPYERADDATKVAKLVSDIARLSPRSAIAIWAPIKDLAGLDALTGAIHDAAGSAPVIFTQARIRPLRNPMMMNGSALIFANAPADLLGVCDEISRWVASALGEAGALGRAELL